MDPHADNLTTPSHDRPAGETGDRPIKLAKIRMAYLADLPGQIAVLKSLLDGGDFAGVQKHAHRIKGTSGTYRLFEIADVMKAIEQFADDGDAALIHVKLDELVEVMDALTIQTQQAYETLTKDGSE